MPRLSENVAYYIKLTHSFSFHRTFLSNNEYRQCNNISSQNQRGRLAVANQENILILGGRVAAKCCKTTTTDLRRSTPLLKFSENKAFSCKFHLHAAALNAEVGQKRVVIQLFESQRGLQRLKG